MEKERNKRDVRVFLLIQGFPVQDKLFPFFTKKVRPQDPVSYLCDRNRRYQICKCFLNSDIRWQRGVHLAGGRGFWVSGTLTSDFAGILLLKHAIADYSRSIESEAKNTKVIIGFIVSRLDLGTIQ